jgi:nitrite reductase/ring-hydroxylating ferredoxin subunit
VVLGERTLVLWSIGGEVYATSHRCPHLGAPLVSGYLDGKVLICPWHGWAFDLSGAEEGPGLDIQRFEVRIEDGDVLVRLD